MNIKNIAQRISSKRSDFTTEEEILQLKKNKILIVFLDQVLADVVGVINIAKTMSPDDDGFQIILCQKENGDFVDCLNEKDTLIYFNIPFIEINVEWYDLTTTASSFEPFEIKDIDGVVIMKGLVIDCNDPIFL